MNDRRTGVLILGAGLQGAGVALELARRGIAVTLLDRDEVPINRASLRNEGKIHLGFIYANDTSLRTASLQMDGALSFRRILARWLGEDAGWLAASSPFHYLVAHDSIVPPEDLARHYAAVERRCRTLFESGGEFDYLGERPEPLVRPLERSEIEAYFDPERCPAGFATAERAIDTERLAVSLRKALADSPDVAFLASHAVRSITEERDGFLVEGSGRGGPWSMHAAQVVNAMWEGRPALDRQIGIAPPANLLHRLKYRVIGRLPPRLCAAPSVSMVLGRYGDVVVRGGGTAYLSWYPAGLRGWSHEIEAPAGWDAACRGELESGAARGIAAEILAGIDPWFPGIGRCEPIIVDAGAIVALGRSDVDDARSGLHDRSRIGVVSRGAYHSVDPGKLTTAPLFALEAADRVEALL